ncbi:MAG: NAD(P)/FAD-dependent oxidoreductase [Bacteroidales bacterium]|nr:NAD(P)/FAD-dependent oxidoreductase [Bacteroidales bacterium]MDD4210542.1 NAD(P)/FAD-dependent oxidoreductase [Bacteroidales bacterium]
MKNKYDIIIIGSGLGGLVCAYILSKNGYKVAVLEKNAQIGGCLQTFKRFGVKFDTGMHYIGSMDENQILYRLFTYLGLLHIPLSRLDPNGYDVISIAGERYKFASGYDNFVETLTKSFPDRKADIQNYVSRIRDIAHASPLYNIQEIYNHTFINADYIKVSINDFIASTTTDVRLQNVLAGNLPLYAGIKDKTPTYIHALINTFYIESAFRVVGGSDHIANSLAHSIRNFGGEIMTHKEVKEILFDDKKATGIRLKNDDIIQANAIISNVHPEATIRMTDTPLIRKVYKERIQNLENSISNFTVYIKFKENTVPYLNYNYYFYERDDVWDSINYDKNNYPQTYLFMHQCHKDKAVYAESAELIAYMKFEEVEQWADTSLGKRGEAYQAFKEKKANQLLSKLEASFPGIRNAIESYETSTPLTYRDYTATKNGSMYGVIRDKNFPTQTLISQRTKVPNLFMTGQNINSHGILGVTIGAIISCAEFLGLNHIIKEIKQAQ